MGGRPWRLSDTLLGCGQVLTGVAPRRAGPKGGGRLSAECRALQGALADKPPKGQAFFISGLGKAAKSVLGLEEDLEARLPPLCSACRGCAECRYRREKCSEEDRAVLARVEKDMVLRGARLEASYPWKACSEKMRDNRQQAVRDQERIEARQIKSGIQEMYQAAVVKAIAAGSLVKLSTEEVEGWPGPIHYINTFGVINNNSLSTKCRVVCDAAKKNARTGLSLNDCMEKGPDKMNQLQDVLLHFRSVESAIILDMEITNPSTQERKRSVVSHGKTTPTQR